MALNIDTQDLENYPGTTKRITVDIDSLVPYGYEGDEQIVLAISTTAYSNNVSRTAIQGLYITEGKSGWLKSSGFKGTKFALDSTHNALRLKIDNTISGSSSYGGNYGYYDIVLAHSNGAYLTGEVVAADLESKIQAIPDSDDWNVADDGYVMSYKNASVEFENGTLKIISGSISNYYTGINRSSIAVASGTINDCSELLGFDLVVSSETLAATTVREVLVTNNYTIGSTSLTIQTGTAAQQKESMAITDGTNTDYFLVDEIIGDSVITVASGSITHNYIADKAKIQVLRLQDPAAVPPAYHTSIDSLARYGLKYIVNQIDYSS